MKFVKDYIRTHHVDNQVLVRIEAGTEVKVEEVIDGVVKVTTEKPCTKNGGNKIYLPSDVAKEYIQ
jgi:hypothetical protein